ncbi:MAG: two-component regulator propeller domain-containing protein [Ignavibacteria bacterium]
MNIILKIFLTSSILLSLFQTSRSQNNLNVEHLSLEQGVSNNLIFTIIQDSKGFIWFGTMFGLVRYDGVKYKTFRYDALNPNSLSNDDIISLCEDTNGNLWIGTYNGGLNKYDRQNEIFIRYLNDPYNKNSISSNYVWEIFQDSKGIMWFGTGDGGLNRFENNKFTIYKTDTLKEGSISGNNVRSIAEDNDGNLWIGTIGGGLNLFDRVKETFLSFKHDSLNKKSINGNSITSILPDENGIIWVSTGRGLNKFDKNKKEFLRYESDSTNPSALKNNYIFSLEKENSNHLLIGTQNGLSRFDKSSDKFEQILIYPERKSQGSVLAFTKDRSGVLWISTYLEGLHKIYESPEKFKNFLPGNNVKSILESKSGLIYAGTTNGLELIDKNGNNINTYLFENKNPNSLSNNEVNSITEDPEGRIWIGTNDGLNKFDPVTKKFKRFYNNPEDSNSLSGSTILKVYADKSGTLWAGTGNGLDMLDKNSGNFTHYKHDENDPNSLSENTVLSIYEDAEHQLWIGTYTGLNKFNKTTGQFKIFRQDPANPKTISSNYVFSFCEDKSGNFWIGTGGGLNIFDRKSETFFSYNERDGLSNSVIAGIVEGNEGYLWLSTFKGISRFDVGKNLFKNYFADDGLQSNLFNTGSYCKMTNGKIVFGGINGYDIIDPNMIENKLVAPVILTSFTKYDGNRKTESDISSSKEIELKYNENVISLSYASLDYTKPKRIKYAYMLEGFDKDWIQNENSNEVIYTNLDPGKYIFKVKATNSEGVWNEQPASINIKINPPFWNTWWFYILLIIAAAGLIIIVQNLRVRNRVRNLIKLEKIKEKEREFMREQASRDYHDELGHKLTRISMYSRRINKKLRPTANGLTQDLNSIIETSNSLQSGAKDLIWAMNPQEDSLYDFAVRLRDFGNELFENTGMQFYTEEINDELRNIVLSMNSKRHLIYIFKEGMNNILKYAGCKNVNLKFTLYDDDIEILLSDDGVGFDIDNCPKGYGLKNIFSRAKQININVNIYSEQTVGTKIRLKTTISNLVTV